MCNWLLEVRHNLQELDVKSVAEEIMSGAALQLFSDGSFNGIEGTAAVVVVVYTHSNHMWTPKVIGYRGEYLRSARSSFQTELQAALMAFSLELELAKQITADARKRTRFA